MWFVLKVKHGLGSRLYFVDFGDKWLQTALKLDRYMSNQIFKCSDLWPLFVWHFEGSWWPLCVCFLHDWDLSLHYWLMTMIALPWLG